MGTLSIHNLDPAVEKRIRQEAEESGKSLNQTIKELLAKATGVAPGGRSSEQRRNQFEDLCGVWSQEEYDGFMEILNEMRQIDSGDWE